MYRLDVRPVEYVEPWRLSFGQRLEALRKGTPRIAYYYAAPDTSTFRYRVFNMVEALTASGTNASASWFTEDDGDGAFRAIDVADTVVLCRAMYTPHVASIIARAKSRRKPLLFDTDDLVFDPRFAHLIMETLDQPTRDEDLTFWFGRLARLGETLRHCDAAIATNPYLAARIRDVHDVSVHVVPNFMNAAQLGLSEQVYQAKRSSFRDECVCIGYFSGTPSHNRDFRLIEPVIAQILEDDPTVRLRIVGFLDLGERLMHHANRIEVLPLNDFMNLQRLVGEVEINLVPLQTNEFTNCKSELKYFEAAVVGTVTVATPIYSYRSAITQGETGFLARAHEWDAVLRALIRDVAQAEGVGTNARRAALSFYTPEAQTKSILTAVSQVSLPW